MPFSLIPPAATELADTGRWRDAFARVAAGWADLARRGSAEDLLWAYDLCFACGLDVRRRGVVRQLERRFPDHPRWRAQRVIEFVRRGRLADAWQASRTAPAGGDAQDRIEWLRALTRVRSELRDHDGAQAAMQEALAIAPHAPRLAIEQAWALLAADRTAEALAVIDAARARDPDHPNVLVAACWLRLDTSAPDAGAELAAACARLQSPPLDSIRANYAFEHGDVAGARAAWEAMLRQPLHERRSCVIMRHALVRACRELGDDAAALTHAEALGRHGEELQRRLREHRAAAEPGPRRRVVLPVPYVRQDHLSCSPATMASLLRTFGVVVDQREIAAQITYDGTGSEHELQWAQARGFVARFFQFEPEAARTLLDLGVPFAITTRYETNSHRQAVVGYDRALGTFVLRDPTGNYRREVPEAWLVAMSRRGGDCALLLPADVAERLTIPPLPAEAETMAWLHLQLRLEGRALAEFEQGVAELLRTATGALRRDVLARLHSLREDRSQSLSLWREALEQAPDDPYWQHHYVLELLSQDCWQEARERLEGWAPTSRSPFLKRLLAEQWRHDAMLRPRAERLLRRALRSLGREPRAWHQYASLVWDEGRRAEAAALYDVAADLAPHEEWLATACFRARCWLGEREAGLARLRDRVRRLGGRSSAPAGTLAHALESLHQPTEAIAVLREALQAHDTPDERARLCHLLLRHHRHAEARELLADGVRFHPLDLAACRAELAHRTGDRAGRTTALHDAVRCAPTHVDSQQAWLEDLLANSGREAALAAADALVAAHGDHPRLLVHVAEFYQRLDDHERTEHLLRRLTGEHPHETWLRGRLARHLLARGKLEDAAPLLATLRTALPNSSPLWADVAEFEHARGDLVAARTAARRALELSPDNEGPLRQLLNWAADADDARATLRLVMRLLAERPTEPDVDTLTNLVRHARSLPPAEVEAWLDGLAASFPSTTAPAVARSNHLRERDPAAALPLIQQLVAREPWVTAHHLRLALCLRECNRRAEQRSALETLLQHDPGCSQAYVEIGESFDDEGRLPQAIATFERGLQQFPGNAILHGMMADAAWRTGEQERALAAAERACELDPSYVWGFQARIRWLGELGRQDEAVALGTALVRDNPRWDPAYDLHAEALASAGRQAERIEVLRAAVALSPRLGSPRLKLIDALTANKRMDDAAAVIRAGLDLLGDDPALQVRQAMLERTAGRIVAAREQLRAVLQRHPEHDPGWYRLLEWCEEEGRGEDILALYRDPPGALRDSPVLYGYAADVLRGKHRLLEAERALEQALEKDQGYAWARHTLCELLLDRGLPARVLELLPDHATPERLPVGYAIFVAKAAARLQRFDVAEAAFRRLLRDESLRGTAIGAIDQLLRERRGAAHVAELDQTVAAAGDDPAVTLNHLRVLHARRDHEAFWRRLTAVHERLLATVGELPVIALLNDAHRDGELPGLAEWVGKHLRGPIRDTRAAGELMHALTQDPACEREMLRLFAADWSRPDIQGWMLANLACALCGQGRFEEMARVADFALQHVPHDHSYWWHRRYLAEAALQAGDLPRARELCEMPVQQYPGVRLSVHQIDLVARLRQAPWWRRWHLLRAALPEMLRRFDASHRESPEQPRSLRGRDLLRLCPGPTALLLCCGQRGLRWLRRLTQA